jgi:HEAT repeat protein
VVLAGHTGDTGVGRAARSDPDAGVRAAAVAAAQRCGTLDEDHLREGLTDADPRVRIRSCRVAATSSLAVEALTDLLDDGDGTVVESACAAAGERADLPDRGVRRLVELTSGHDDALVREAAVAALGSLAGEGRIDELDLTEEVVTAILRAGDDVAAVRRRVAVATAAFEDPRVEALCERFLADRDLQVRQIAEDLLEVGGTPTASPVELRTRTRDADDPATGGPGAGSSSGSG